MRKICVGAAVGVLSAALSCGVLAQRFEDHFHFKWLPDPDGTHHRMELLSPVALIDRAGVRWEVPTGQTTDGASIPRWLWSVAGSPFTGKYRRAAVIHDYLCDQRSHPAYVAHRVFREGMEADGTSWWEALSKYAAVSLFGGGCGKDVQPPHYRLSQLKTEAGDEELLLRLDEDVIGMVQAFEEEPSDNGERHYQLVQEAEVTFAETLKSLVGYRDFPTYGSYLQIEYAVFQENPTPLQMDILIEFARAVVPDRGLEHELREATQEALWQREIAWARMSGIL